MILSRFFIHLGFFAAFLAIFIPLVTVVTIPAFDFNKNFRNTTCLVQWAASESSSSNFRGAASIRCNNPYNVTRQFNGSVYEPANGQLQAVNPVGWIADMNALIGKRIPIYIANGCFTNITSNDATYIAGCNLTLNLVYPSVIVPDGFLMYLDYRGWALVLELLFGVVGVISLIGMIFSCVFDKSQVDGMD
eukprot:TRINITY_DN6322_c0_g1_i1.p1 TRINITY_DN6322_c0_g1~~TRINITY_DN6322_c0_g1_i1.p1  ORF type:complete len:191 (-),score=24.58 TRINITY_DN6322_c0_g1_i1:62-634(-)